MSTPTPPVDRLDLIQKAARHAAAAVLDTKTAGVGVSRVELFWREEAVWLGFGCRLADAAAAFEGLVEAILEWSEDSARALEFEGGVDPLTPGANAPPVVWVGPMGFKVPHQEFSDLLFIASEAAWLASWKAAESLQVKP